MLPAIAVGLIAIFSALLLASAGKSPPLRTITWEELPHAVAVTVAAAIGISLYTTLGFVLTMALLIFGLLIIVERARLFPAAAYSIGLTVSVKLLLGALLKSPLPLGPFGF